MLTDQRTEKFRQSVENKFLIYNNLFMNLPYDKMANITKLLPFLYDESKVGYHNGKSPIKILDYFFEKYLEGYTEDQKIDLLFKFIRYIERQVVLFDSIEDAAFQKLHSEADAGTVMHLYERALQENKMEEVRDKMEDFGVKVVFTAHPTQFYPSSVQRILHDLRTAIMDDNVEEIDLLLQQLGKTPFVNRNPPTPFDEAMSIIYYLRYVYYDTIGELYKKIKTAFSDQHFKPDENLIQLGFWPGGDRDGNPFVTAEITMKVARELRSSILKSHYNRCKFVIRKLSFRGVAEILENLSKQLYSNMFFNDESLTAESILEQLNKAEKILREEHNGLFLSLLDEFRDRVKIFGTHFATLDIRQDSGIHRKVIADIIAKKSSLSVENLSDEEKLQFLLNADFTLNPDDFENEITKDTIKTITQVIDIQKLNGERGMYRYIISNSESQYDVMFVYALFLRSGYQPEDIRVDIVPLFETLEGLDNAQSIIKDLYELPLYIQHLERRKKEQTIMLGFSDGTKYAGYLKANWEIYTAKEQLTQISEEKGFKVIFFDGRGGPPSRGGGKTHQFYASQGKTIANNRIEITIQGQTITSVFGNKDQAKYNFEQLLTAGIDNEVFESSKREISQAHRDLMDELSELSYEKYHSLKNHPSFVPYLQEMSTLPYYGKTNIGSRPSKRGAQESLKFEDLRAIPFVGSWSQLKQNVPGFYGFGSALQRLKEQGRLEEVKALYRQSDFFKTLVLNSMMSMNKSFFPLTYYMKNHPKFGEFWNNLHDEFILSRDLMFELTGFTILQQEEPISRLSVNLREKIVLPLLTIQQYALMKIHEGTENREIYEKLVIRSLFGNINASRNSA